jgi:hypothetical protein
MITFAVGRHSRPPDTFCWVAFEGPDMEDAMMIRRG